MEISRNVIIGRRIQKKAPEILTFLLKLHDDFLDPGNPPISSEDKRRVGHHCFLITTTTRDNHMLYILSGAELLRRNMDLDRVRILGIAGSGREAREIVRMIIEDVAADGAVTRLKEYLETY